MYYVGVFVPVYLEEDQEYSINFLNRKYIYMLKKIKTKLRRTPNSSFIYPVFPPSIP